MLLREICSLDATIRNAKITIISLLFTLLLLSPNLHNAASFADDKMLTRLERSYNSQAKQRGIALNKLLQQLADKDVKHQLKEVNRFFNQFQYKTDQQIWNESDYWATPEEFLGKGKGDCEDYVVAKYFALRSLGVPDNQLYLSYVKAVRENIAHMVLSYFETPKSMPLILDNYNHRILPASKRRDLLPVYSFNAESLFLSNSSAGLGRALPTDKIKNNKWQKLLANVKGSKP